MWKRIFVYLNMIGLLWLFCLQQVTAEELIKDNDLYAQSAVLMDAETGRILFAKNEEEKRANASTTKILTCILVLENGALNDTVEVSSYAASQPKVHLGMKASEQYPVKDLLYSMMLESHNDSAVALAEYIAAKHKKDATRPSDRTQEESKKLVLTFSDLMNQKAKEIGCTQTFFLTPNGLDAVSVSQDQSGSEYQINHGTTAKELAMIMRYCILESEKRELFAEIAKTMEKAVREITTGREVLCRNHNALLWQMDGVIAGKTGFTGKAGYCYVGAVKVKDRIFIVSLLASGWPNARNYKWKDTEKLIKFGEVSFETKPFPKDLITQIQFPQILVENGCDPYGNHIPEMEFTLENTEIPKSVFLKKGEQIHLDWYVKPVYEAPLEQGEACGQLIVYTDDWELFRTKIVSAKRIDRYSFERSFKYVLRAFFLFF